MHRIWTSLTTMAVGGAAVAMSPAEIDASSAGIGSADGIGATALTPHRLARRPGRDGFPGALVELESCVAAAAPLRSKINQHGIGKRTWQLGQPVGCFQSPPKKSQDGGRARSAWLSVILLLLFTENNTYAVVNAAAFCISSWCSAILLRNSSSFLSSSSC